MKRKILTLTYLFFIFYSSLFSQSLEWNVQQNQYTKIKSAISLDNGKWLLGGTYFDANDFNHDAYFRMIDSSGTIWGVSSVPAAGGISESTEMLKKAGSFIFEVGKNRENYTVQKYSLDSNKLNRIHSFYYDEFVVINDLDILPNGNVIVAGSQIVNSKKRAFFAAYSNDLETEFVFWTLGNVGQANDIEVLDDGSFLIIGEFEFSNSPYGVRRFSDNFGDYGISASGATYQKVNKKINGKYFAYQDDNLSLLNSNFITTNSIDLSSYGNIIDIESDDNSTFVLCQGETTAPNILEFNNDFELVNTFSYGSKFLRLNDLILNENEISFAGHAIPSVPLENEITTPSLSGYFRSFPRPLNTNFPAHDLEISDVRIPHSEKNNECTNGYSRSFVIIDLKKVSVDIVNHGEDTISSGYLFLQLEGLKSCYIGISNNSTSFLRKKHFFNLNLAPNDTATIDILNFEFPKLLNESYHIDLCAWVSAVDKKLDTNNENDFYCGKIPLKGIDFSDSEETAGIYPNPANDFINVSLKLTYLEETEIEIYTFMGQLVYKSSIPFSSDKKFIDISSFQEGSYFLNIKNSKIKETLQFVK
ncbi:MAG: T9SS type A sorting domain-containing protein [Saprospiraceae bacterium]